MNVSVPAALAPLLTVNVAEAGVAVPALYGVAELTLSVSPFCTVSFTVSVALPWVYVTAQVPVVALDATETVPVVESIVTPEAELDGPWMLYDPELVSTVPDAFFTVGAVETASVVLPLCGTVIVELVYARPVILEAALAPVAVNSPGVTDSAAELSK